MIQQESQRQRHGRDRTGAQTDRQRQRGRCEPERQPEPMQGNRQSPSRAGQQARDTTGRQRGELHRLQEKKIGRRTELSETRRKRQRVESKARRS